MKINKRILDICSENLMIEFSDEEKKFLYDELLDVIDYFEEIKLIDVNNVEPTNYSISTENLLRDDNEYDNNAVEYIKKSIKNYKNGYVKVQNE